MFPIPDKISKPGFRAPEKHTRENSGFDKSAILRDNKLNIILKLLLLFKRTFTTLFTK